jgi:hypothetical protein
MAHWKIVLCHFLRRAHLIIPVCVLRQYNTADSAHLRVNSSKFVRDHCLNVCVAQTWNMVSSTVEQNVQRDDTEIEAGRTSLTNRVIGYMRWN